MHDVLVKTKADSLEELLAEVRARREAKGRVSLPQSGWRKVAGTVKDDELFREAARLGEIWRGCENERH